ncbi:hypothetical protein TIFTF001_030915 [Ficus carica]|uniref:C-JID domain-containing protein n=1 Tax=Ficus carica TaxID=3494 RepID=A0AA88DZK4_FICCA|nr:hypothetical protein TIFTF001_030915 [Ficus carica]
MSLNIHELESDIDLNPLVFKAMINLKYLSIDKYFDDLTKKLNLPQGLLSLPDKLRYLCWNRYPSRTLPPNFKPQNFVELNLRGSKLEKLWDGVQNFGSLKVLDLEESENLIEIPNLSQALNVEKIYLTGCTSLEHLPSSVCKLKSLQLLRLNRCSKIAKVNLQSDWDCIFIPWALPKSQESSNHHLFLESLPELPLTIETVDASGCTSLKMESNLLTALTQPPTDRVNLGVTFSFRDCLKLEHQNILSEFQMRASLIATEFALRKTPDKSCPPTTKMCYPGDNIPEWFSYQKKGRSINIRLPCNSNFMGFAFCFILSCEEYNGWGLQPLHLDGEIYVKTFDGDERHLPLPLKLLPSNDKNHVVMTTFMCDVVNFYPAVEMSFNFGTGEEAYVKIKRCGIRLLHVQDAMEFGIISSHFVCRKSNVVNDEGGPSLSSWESILEQLRHFQVSSSRKKLREKIWSSNLNHWYKILCWQLLRDSSKRKRKWSLKLRKSCFLRPQKR